MYPLKELPGVIGIVVDSKKKRRARAQQAKAAVGSRQGGGEPAASSPDSRPLPAEIVSTCPEMRNRMLQRVELLEKQLAALQNQLSKAVGSSVGEAASDACHSAAAKAEAVRSSGNEVQAAEVEVGDDDLGGWLRAASRGNKEAAIGEPIDFYTHRLERSRVAAMQCREDIEALIREAQGEAARQRKLLAVREFTV